MARSDRARFENEKENEHENDGDERDVSGAPLKFSVFARS
jgi:hypothetical protein